MNSSFPRRPEGTMKQISNKEYEKYQQTGSPGCTAEP